MRRPKPTRGCPAMKINVFIKNPNTIKNSR
jgi:hypothetical protein